VLKATPSFAARAAVDNPQPARIAPKKPLGTV
jgi:hypothetical protein